MFSLLQMIGATPVPTRSAFSVARRSPIVSWFSWYYLVNSSAKGSTKPTRGVFRRRRIRSTLWAADTEQTGMQVTIPRSQTSLPHRQSERADYHGEKTVMRTVVLMFLMFLAVLACLLVLAFESGLSGPHPATTFDYVKKSNR